jgi:hypothetical protein
MLRYLYKCDAAQGAVWLAAAAYFFHYCFCLIVFKSAVFLSSFWRTSVFFRKDQCNQLSLQGIATAFSLLDTATIFLKILTL